MLLTLLNKHNGKKIVDNYHHACYNNLNAMNYVMTASQNAWMWASYDVRRIIKNEYTLNKNTSQ